MTSFIEYAVLGMSSLLALERTLKHTGLIKPMKRFKWHCSSCCDIDMSRSNENSQVGDSAGKVMMYKVPSDQEMTK